METAFLKLPFSTKMAIISFILGTLLFLGYFVAEDKLLFLILGLIYVIIALISNLFMLIILLFDRIEYPTEKNEISNQILILLANIPISILYFIIIFYT
jgi:hypothetical protein